MTENRDQEVIAKWKPLEIEIENCFFKAGQEHQKSSNGLCLFKVMLGKPSPTNSAVFF